jgi:hypothetical protein
MDDRCSDRSREKGDGVKGIKEQESEVKEINRGKAKFQGMET